MNKSEMKRKRKQRKILLTIIMILFTGIVLTASTYAWFTSNQTVTVDSIDVNVAATDGLQISVDAQDWKAIVTAADIKSATWSGVTNQMPTGSMYPVSTVGQIDGATGFMNFYKGTIDTSETKDETGTFASILTAVKDTEDTDPDTNGNFAAFDLFFQTANDVKLYLKGDSGVIAKGEDSTDTIQNAARVAFVVQGAVDTTANPTSALALKAPAQADYSTPTTVGETQVDNVYFWEPNFDVHSAEAINHASIVYGIGGLSQTGASRLSYYGVKAPIAKGNNIKLAETNGTNTDVNYFKEISSPEIQTAKGNTEDKFAFNLTAGVTKVRVYMWVEGQDVDCEDNASGGSITYNLKFTVKQPSNS